MSARFLGIDVGAETIKVVGLAGEGHELQPCGQWIVEHHKEPARALAELLTEIGWDEVEGAAACGRLSRGLRLQRVPEKQARATGFRFLHPGPESATLVSIGSHGFSVLELRPGAPEVFRENSRCSQGTGNFLRQLVERFDLEIEEASRLCATVEDPAPLSGRCPVILKTDMTHLANQGLGRPRILAGLYDAVAENVQVLVKPRSSPGRVHLLGGVSRSARIRRRFAGFLERHGMELVDSDERERLFLDALGCACVAAEEPGEALPALDALVDDDEECGLELLPPLVDSLHRVRRMSIPEGADEARPSGDGLVLGLDIGSTGSKAVALDARLGVPLWQGYVNTNGDPVGAAQLLVQRFVDGPLAQEPVVAIGATGSGREIVGSLLTTCYGPSSVFVLNEIAAHAEGALYYDPRVDTVFEIGGQDAKYIRLAEGRVVDAAMNEACSAGTGSFIEEQGRRFSGIRDVVHLGEEALTATQGVSLGQHCSVFMAEIIDEAVAAGLRRSTIVAGIYDSIIQNYLNRVKGSRDVGQVIFCQGMPFSSDALAAAVARQTGAEVVIPPNPGTIGALGISLLTRKERLEDPEAAREPLGLQRFLGARIEARESFVCKSTKGCGGSGNRCRIDRIRTVVEGAAQRFTWGGACSLYDRGTGRTKLPDRAPDPFRQREEAIDELIAGLRSTGSRPRIALTDEFLLKGLFPFFATYLQALGFDLEVHRGASQALLKRGIEDANVAFCAPMQQYHGLVSQMAESEPDYLFLPMVRSISKVKDETASVLCPVVQASPDLLRWDLGAERAGRVLSPVIDVDDEGLSAGSFAESCRRLAASLGARGEAWRRPFEEAVAAQEAFRRKRRELGREALDFCEEQGIVPVVVLGRPYTIYNRILNSNVPAILREQGAIPIPVDCYPVGADVPVFQDVYWAYGQRNLRAAHQVRRTRGSYSLWASNYSCGPDSFNLHFYSYMMQGKPYAIIETDGHSGDAGTRTRVEAFLYCVRQDLEAAGDAAEPTTPREAPRSFKLIELDKEGLVDVQRRRERVLIPRMGPGAEALAACLRGLGMAAESLPVPDQEALSLGRRHTSGKECVPMCITLGSLLQRLQGEEASDELFSFFMPTAKGPCRFGVYNLLHKIVLERLGWKDRVRLWSPNDSNYFEGVPHGFVVLAFACFMAMDLLLEGFYDARPAESVPGVSEKLHERFKAELLELVERAAGGDVSLPYALVQVANGRLFGITGLLRRAAEAFASVRRPVDLPTVLVVGEIYVRCDPFSNDFTIDRLEERGIRVRFAPFNEWIEYVDHINRTHSEKAGGVGTWVSSGVRQQIQTRCYDAMAQPLGWGPRTRVTESVAAAAPYIREELDGEAVLTIGGPLHEWHQGMIDGVVSLGPLECMPTKIAQAQFFHIGQREGLASLTLELNGDPVDPQILDNFAYEVRAAFRRRQARGEPRTKSWLQRSGQALAKVGRTITGGLPAAVPGPVVQAIAKGLNGHRPAWFPAPEEEGEEVSSRRSPARESRPR